jgi:hypothetical protein
MATIQKRLTLLETISRAMLALGIYAPASITNSSDKNVEVLWSLANDCGLELLSEAAWQFLSADHTITTTGATTYALPSDFQYYVPDSDWNRTSKHPMQLANEQEWAHLKARSLGGTTVGIIYRIDDDMVELYSAPSSAQTLVLPYISRSWVESSGGTAQDNLLADDDIILYDQTLFRKKLLLAWKTARGFDTTAAEREYQQALAAAKTADSPSRTIVAIPGGGIGAAPLLGYYNIPDTGYGS